MYLSLRVRSRAGNVIADIAGDIDMNSGPWLEDSLLRFLRISGTCLLADLSGVTFIDCAGLRMLITTCRTAELQASALRFTNLSPQVRRLADLTGLREALPLAVPREGPVLPGADGAAHRPVRAENLVHGSDQQGCSPGSSAVRIIDHVPTVRVPPDHARRRVAAAVAARGCVEDRGNPDPAP